MILLQFYHTIGVRNNIFIVIIICFYCDCGKDTDNCFNLSSLGRNSEKDPNRPKRAQSAYFIFMGDYREKCKRTGEADTSNVSSIALSLN